MKVEKAYTTIDVHVAGEAFRIIKDAPFIHYSSLEQLDEQFPRVYEEVINLLLNEPRGFAGLNGCLVVPPFSRDADAAVVFFNHDGTVPLQYGGIVAVITALLETGQLSEKESNHYKIETVSGVIPVTAVMENDEVVLVKLENEPCQVVETNVSFSHSELSQYSLVQADQLYAIFDKGSVPFEIRVEDLSELRNWGKSINEEFSKLSIKVTPVLLDRTSLNTGVIKTVTLRGDNFIVRSPGFGATAACYTSLLSKDLLSIDQPLENESIFNSKLKAELTKQIESSYQFTFTCRAFITGMQTYVLDPTDPLAAGFLLK
ncbi:proline racemase family protein [Heyndrickxia sporothermodurans]|uniref:proline racemase family protein n=1 Tax=Heyndrickxia sporothermodurans TaxID=46224 RepID=UPI002DBBF76D|nr:proline racemase family protein [Heyndrickxia sporothermodurans]MEB6548595.1 proline racemase family protein [Heyndrickxia sporothermodurans]